MPADSNLVGVIGRPPLGVLMRCIAAGATVVDVDEMVARYIFGAAAGELFDVWTMSFCERKWKAGENDEIGIEWLPTGYGFNRARSDFQNFLPKLRNAAQANISTANFWLKCALQKGLWGWSPICTYGSYVDTVRWRELANNEESSDDAGTDAEKFAWGDEWDISRVEAYVFREKLSSGRSLTWNYDFENPGLAVVPKNSSKPLVVVNLNDVAEVLAIQSLGGKVVAWDEELALRLRKKDPNLTHLKGDLSNEIGNILSGLKNSGSATKTVSKIREYCVKTNSQRTYANVRIAYLNAKDEYSIRHLEELAKQKNLKPVNFQDFKGAPFVQLTKEIKRDAPGDHSLIEAALAGNITTLIADTIEEMVGGSQSFIYALDQLVFENPENILVYGLSEDEFDFVQALAPATEIRLDENETY